MVGSSFNIDDLDFEELKGLVVQLFEELTRVKSKNEDLRAEVARLKGLNGKPDIKPSKPSGMEQQASPRSGKGKKRNKVRRRGSKNNKLSVDETRIIKPATVPEGSRFKGYQTSVVQDLILHPWTVRYRRQRWLTPSGETIIAPMPTGVIGHYGAALVQFALAQYHQCQVTVPRLAKQLRDFGFLISERHVLRLLNKDKDRFVSEACGILRAGLETSKWINVDDTGARHQGRNGYCTHIGNDCFAWYCTGFRKSRLNFLEMLRAGDTGYTINDAALDYMRDHRLSGPVIKKIEEHETRAFTDQDAWIAHLQALGIPGRKVSPDPVVIATEAALWGRVTALGFLRHAVILSDGAGQFRVGDHALCWIHSERLIYKLDAFSHSQRKAIERIRHRIWWLYADIKIYCHDPTGQRKRELTRRFDNIFTAKTGFVMLDRQLKRLHAHKNELLKVLERPDIPLHTNGSENDIRCQVIKRKISGGTRSNEGRQCRDAFLSLAKTCAKLGISFWHYLGNRLATTDCLEIHDLSSLVRRAQTA